MHPPRPRKQKLQKRPGYYVEIIHENPKGEPRTTLMEWGGKRSRKALRLFLMEYESFFGFKRTDVRESLGYQPKPCAINLRNGITRHIVASWKRAA